MNNNVVVEIIDKNKTHHEIIDGIPTSIPFGYFSIRLKLNHNFYPINTISFKILINNQSIIYPDWLFTSSSETIIDRIFSTNLNKKLKLVKNLKKKSGKNWLIQNKSSLKIMIKEYDPIHYQQHHDPIFVINQPNTMIQYRSPLYYYFNPNSHNVELKTYIIRSKLIGYTSDHIHKNYEKSTINSIYCHQCGTKKFHINDKYCRKCGTKL